MIRQIFLTLVILLLNSSVNAAILSGQITLADGTPVPGMRVTVTVAGTDTELPHVTTDSNGDYSLSLSSNTYDLELSLFGDYPEEMIGRQLNDWRNKNIDVSTDVTYDITLDWVKITGKTVDDEGLGIAGTYIGISGNYELNGGWNIGVFFGGGAEMELDNSVLSDSNGNYSFWVPPHNDYTVQMNPPEGSGFGVTLISGVDFSDDTTRDFALENAAILAPIIMYLLN